jgi:hypothetical protein
MMSEKQKANFLRSIKLQNKSTTTFITIAYFDGTDWVLVLEDYSVDELTQWLNAGDNKIDNIQLIEE